MRISPVLVSLLAVIIPSLLLGEATLAQTPPPPICNNVDCSPDPSSSTYIGGTVQARPASKNQRGSSSTLSAVARETKPQGDTQTVTLAGSSSFGYAIPVLHLPGRNGLDFDLTLYYNSALWAVDTVHSTVTLNASRDFPGYGFRLGFGSIEGPYNLVAPAVASYILTEPDGTVRELRQLGSTTATESVDNSHIAYDYSTGTLRRKDGAQWKYTPTKGGLNLPTQITDSNGNYITISYHDTKIDVGFDPQSINQITDTLGRTITFNYDTSGRLQSISAPAFGGTSTYSVLTLTWSQIALSYNFASSLKVTDTIATGTTINVITACRYPNGTGYNFIYGDWGIAKEIDLVSANGSARSSESYNYPLASAGSLTDAPTFTQKSVFDGVQTANWTYQVTKVGGVVGALTLTDPSGFTYTTDLATSGWQTGLTSETVVENGSVILQLVQNTWTQDNTNVTYPTNPRLTTSVTQNEVAQQSQISYAYDGYGNINQTQEYDYGKILARTTQTDFQTSSSYVTQHILDRPLESRTYDGKGNLTGKTDFAYDAAGSLSLSVSGAAHHDDTNYGSGTTVRGNLSSITRYPNPVTTAGAITRNLFYDTLGNLITAQLDCCQSESITFSSKTQYGYPDSVTKGPSGGTQLTTSWSYDFNTGLTISTADPNTQALNYFYDAANRLIEVTGPLASDLKLSYDDNAAKPLTTTSALLDSVSSARLVSLITTDGLGHVLQQQTQDASGTVQSTSQAQYDAFGRVSQSSTPFSPL